MHAVEQYLTSMGEIRRTGAAVPETSYYGCLETLLNEVGGDLSPGVRAVVTPRDEGAGLPDGGFFTADQLSADIEDPLSHVLPARGALEVKSPERPVDEIAELEQVRRYAEKYGQVLVTNYREFLLLAADAGGIRRLERFELADDAAAFWALTAHPQSAAADHGDELLDFLKRVREALEGALGVDFRGERGEHFFQSTLVQTLFYGVFSAWVLWHRQRPDRTDRFDWRLAEWSLRVPMIRALFEQVATASRVQELGLTDVLGWASAALDRVDRSAFFERFEEEHAVQYFYEPFLEAFDPELRKQLGVWYTPPEVVRFMVERVDRVLRDELGIDDGLADDRVVVLDPCCGTGAYLVEVLERIGRTLRERGEGALVGAALRRAASERVFGFEILPAPFVVSHLQLGLLLHGEDADAEQRRAGVYLTNALTGWLGEGEEITLPLREFEEERDAAEHVKRDERVLVVLGNPPYNGYAGMGMDEERELVEAYRETARAPKPRGQGLNDLYVRFYRMAERRITEMTGRGVVCFISNYSWLSGLSFTGMRETYLDAFDRVWIDNLHGDRIIGERAPGGASSETIFSIRGKSPGIKVGTAIATFVRREAHKPTAEILYRDFHDARADERRNRLVEAPALAEPKYEVLSPVADLGFPFRPVTTGADYLAWPSLTELLPQSVPGVQSKRDEVVVDIDRSNLEHRIGALCDSEVSLDELKAISPRAVESTRQYQPRKVRDYLAARGMDAGTIRRYYYRPFDVRWIYWEGDSGLLSRPSPQFMKHLDVGSLWIEARQRQSQLVFDRGYVASGLSDNFGNGFSNFFPMYVRAEHGDLFDSDPDRTVANLTPGATGYIKRLNADPEHLFHHITATLHAPEYGAENAGALRQDWPRIPLPDTREALLAGTELGERLATLFDPERVASGVSSGNVRDELRVLGVVTREDGGELREADLALTARWGYSGARGAVMPGRGRVVERGYTSGEMAAMGAGALELGMSEEQAVAMLGERTVDVHLNDVACWSNVPARVWEYTLGGYPVVKKWLSYRERDVLGRDLELDEVRYVTEMVRRIAAILLLGPALDAHYAAVKESARPLVIAGADS